MEIQVTLPLNYKDLQVTVTPTNLAVRLKNETVIEGQFHRKIRATETIWSVDKNILQVIRGSRTSVKVVSFAHLL